MLGGKHLAFARGIAALLFFGVAFSTSRIFVVQQAIPLSFCGFELLLSSSFFFFFGGGGESLHRAWGTGRNACQNENIWGTRHTKAASSFGLGLIVQVLLMIKTIVLL